MKKLASVLILTAMTMTLISCGEAETSSMVSMVSEISSIPRNSIVSMGDIEELSIDNYRGIAAGLEDWQDFAEDSNTKIYQSTSESTLFKYEIVLEKSTVVDYSYITPPTIEYLTDDVIKISRGLGSNLATVEYLKLADGMITNESEEYLTYGYSTEYIAYDDMLVAYTGSVSRGETEEVAVIVRDIFNGSEKAEVIRDYYALAEVVESMEFADGDTLTIVYKQCADEMADGYQTVTEKIELD